MGGQGQPGAGQGAGGFGMSGPSSMGGSAFGQQGMGGSGFGQSTGGFSLDSNPGGSTSSAQQNSAFFGEGNQGGGTFIVGVASTSHKQSIRIWNQKTHYDEWEFIGVDLGALGIATSIPGLPQGVGGQSGEGDASSAFGQPGQGTAPGAFGQQPQGNTMTPGQDQGAFSRSNTAGSRLSRVTLPKRSRRQAAGRGISLCAGASLIVGASPYARTTYHGKSKESGQFPCMI